MKKSIVRAQKPSYSEGESLSQVVWRRFKHHTLAKVGLITLSCLILLAVFAPYVVVHSPSQLNLDLVADGKPLPPSLQHPFGTDVLGRDYLSRAIYGGRISLAVGFVAVAFSMTIGVTVGAIAGYYGGLIDNILCRIIDVLLCIPTFFLILTVNAFLRPNIFNVMVVIGVFGWMGTARLIRGEFLSLREQEFAEAARTIGASDARIVFRHILPNAMAPAIVSATMQVAGAILTESGLSYLGMGVQEPTPSWGSMLQAGQRYLTTAPWLAIFPGLLISITVLAFNFIGDGLRDSFDPKLRD